MARLGGRAGTGARQSWGGARASLGLALLACAALALPAPAGAQPERANPTAAEQGAANQVETGRVVPAQPETSLAELEDEVMCPICGTLLGLAEAPQAERQRVLIGRLIDQGRSKEEIKEILVAEYGPEVLALPEGSGFSLSAYLVPIVGFAIAIIALGLAVRRWRKEAFPRAEAHSGAANQGAANQGDIEPSDTDPSAAETARLEADLARYDL